MPAKNWKKSDQYMPNGQLKETFQKECHDFLETYYTQLLKYALYHEGGEKDRADDLLHKTILILMEGRDNINFHRAPRTYFNLMMRREKERRTRVKQPLFEGGLLIDDREEDLPFETPSPSDQQRYEDWSADERANDPYKALAGHFDALCKELTPTEVQHLDWYLDGLSREEMKQYHNVSNKRLDQLLTKARRKIKKAVEARIQVAE